MCACAHAASHPNAASISGQIENVFRSAVVMYLTFEETGVIAWAAVSLLVFSLNL